MFLVCPDDIMLLVEEKCWLGILRDLAESEAGVEQMAPTAAALDDDDDPPVPQSG